MPDRMTAPSLDDVDAACRWWNGYVGDDYATATTADVTAALRACPDCAAHIVTLERCQPRGGDADLIALAESVAT